MGTFDHLYLAWAIGTSVGGLVYMMGGMGASVGVGIIYCMTLSVHRPPPMHLKPRAGAWVRVCA